MSTARESEDHRLTFTASVRESENSLKTALIVGAGFSCEAGLPNTGSIVESFLGAPRNGTLAQGVEDEISAQLAAFWRYVFGHNGSGPPPSLEDHFTVIDLAANTGRNLGPEYPPKKLRAIRRLSIQRIFQILDRHEESPVIDHLLSKLHRDSELSVVSTNWDIVVQNHLTRLGTPYWYGIPVEYLDGTKMESKGIPLLMLHGSANWIYCDSCRRLYVGQPESGKAALQSHIYVDKNDFQQLCPTKPRIIASVERTARVRQKCFHCSNRLGARLATFSYRKEVSIPQFQTVWQKAFAELRDSDKWLFVGYSLPEADFEFRHLLKSAEKGVRPGGMREIQVVLKDDCEAGKRFRRFFGISGDRIHQDGLRTWVSDHLAHWLGS